MASPPPPPPPPPPRINRATAGKAVDSILTWLRAHSKKQKDSLYLVLALHKVPHRGRSLSFPLPLPHPFPLPLNNEDTPNPKKTKKTKKKTMINDSSSTTMLHFRGGTCSGIRVGATSHHTRDEIVDNVIAAAEEAIRHVPKKWANVRSFHVKAAESLAIPIYPEVAGEGGKRKSELEDGVREKVKRRRKSDLGLVVSHG